MKFSRAALIIGVLMLSAVPTSAAGPCDCSCQYADGSSEALGSQPDIDACTTACRDATPPGVSGDTIVQCEVEVVVPPDNPAAADGAAASSAIPKLINPLGEGTTTNTLIGRIINALLGIVGSIALLMFVYGGFMWLTSGGAEDKIKKGKETLVWASLGLVIIFSAYALLNFVLTRALGLI